MKETVRDFSGKIIGFIETDSKGNTTVREFSGKILGRYDAHADVTRDFSGFVIAKGNHSSMLFGRS